MKTHITRNRVKFCFRNIFQCGYCELQDIFWDEAPHYNAGVYGWNYDVFVDYPKDVAITTGYRGMFGKRIPHDLLREFSKRGRKIKENRTYHNAEETREQYEKMQDDFFSALESIGKKEQTN